MATTTIRNHGLMDIKPVGKNSVAKALGWSLLYVLLVVGFVWWLVGDINEVMTFVLVVAALFMAISAVVAFRAKYRQENGIEIVVHGAQCQGSTLVHRPANDVPRVINEVCLHDPELGVRTNAVEGGAIGTGMSFGSWGERIRFAVEPLSANDSKVTATCRPVIPFIVTNWGRSERLLYGFLRNVHEVAAAEPASSPEGA